MHNFQILIVSAVQNCKHAMSANCFSFGETSPPAPYWGFAPRPTGPQTLWTIVPQMKIPSAATDHTLATGRVTAYSTVLGNSIIRLRICLTVCLFISLSVCAVDGCLLTRWFIVGQVHFFVTQSEPIQSAWTHHQCTEPNPRTTTVTGCVFAIRVMKNNSISVILLSIGYTEFLMCCLERSELLLLLLCIFKYCIVLYVGLLRPHTSGMTLCWPFNPHCGELSYVLCIYC